MIVHIASGKTFKNQKSAKEHFGNHHYRRKVKCGEIYFTNYNKPVANDGTESKLQKTIQAYIGEA